MYTDKTSCMLKVHAAWATTTHKKDFLELVYYMIALNARCMLERQHNAQNT